MKKIIKVLFPWLIIAFMPSCSKDNQMASRMDGVWTISKSDVFHWDSTANNFVLYQTYDHPGTVTLVDEGMNKKRDHYSLYTNPGNLNLPSGSGSGDYYWSVDVGPNNDIMRIDFMYDDNPWYYYFSYSIKWENRKTMIWTRFDNIAAGMDNGNNVKEVWTLEKQ